jgi:hypothetical protein
MSYLPEVNLKIFSSNTGMKLFPQKWHQKMSWSFGQFMPVHAQRQRSLHLQKWEGEGSLEEENPKLISTAINQLQGIFKNLLSELQNSILSQQLRRLIEARHGNKKQILDVLNKGTDLITWERGARVPACTVCIPRITACTLRKNRPIPHVSAYATDIVRVPNSIHMFLRSQLFWGCRWIFTRFVLSFYLCVYLVFFMSIFYCTTTCFVSTFRCWYPVCARTGKFPCGTISSSMWENSGETHIMNMSLPRKKAPFVRRPPLV